MGQLGFGVWDGFAARSIGYDLFCANHRFGPMPVEQSLKPLKLFGDEVIPAFRG